MNPLDQLKDIYTPEAVDWWPLAWGWWTLIILLFIALISLAVIGYRQYKFNYIRRQAISELKTLSLAAKDWHVQANAVLKRVAVEYYTAECVAPLFGNQWVEFLLDKIRNQNLQSKMRAPLEAMQQSLYRQTTISQVDTELWSSTCLSWLENAQLKQAALIEVKGGANV